MKKMVSTEDELHVQKDVHAAVDLLLKFNLDEIAKGLPGNSVDSSIFLERIWSLLHVIRSCHFEGIGHATINQLSSKIRELQRLTDRALSPTPEKPATINEYRDLWDKLSTLTLPIIQLSNHLNPTSSSLLENLEAINKSRLEANSIVEKIRKTAKTTEEEITSWYQKSVVAKHQGNFHEEAKWNLAGSIAWLIISLSSAGLLVWYVECCFSSYIYSAYPIIGPNLPLALVIQLAVSKLVIVSLLTYSVVFSAKNFYAHRHNHTINVHRRNALGSFEAFANNCDDKQIREALLMEAAKAVFSPQVTGFLKNESEPAHSGQIIEIVRTLAGKS